MFHGPATPGPAGSVFIILLAVVFVTAAIRRGTRVRGAFMYGKGDSQPINPASRVLLVMISLVLLYAGIRGLVK